MNALLTYTVGGQQYPLTASSRCRTCRSRHRRTIECRLVEGATPADALRDIDDADKPNTRNIREHVARGHLPVESELVRQLINTGEGGQRANLVEQGVAARVNALGFASAIITETNARIASGELRVSVRDGIRAARLLAEHDTMLRKERRGTELLTQAREATVAILDLAKANMTSESWSAFLKRMEEDELLRIFVPVPR